MDMFDSIVNAAKDVADKAGKKTEEVVAISKLRLKCAQTKSEIEKAYGRLGKILYDCKKADIQNEELINVCVMEIQELITQLDADTAKLMELKKLVRCTSCGSANPIDAFYCSRCGAKLEHSAEVIIEAEEESVVQPEENPGDDSTEE